MYVDVSLVDKLDRQTKWARLEETEVQRWAKENPDSKAYFCTVQRFEDSTHKEGELQTAPMYFDLDSENIQESLRDARTLVDALTKGFDIEPQIWFTGNRGFHIEVPAGVMGIEPHPHLTYHYRYLAEDLIERTTVKTADRTVYSIRRMWRIENTKHSKTGLYKVRLTPSELMGTIESIRELAKEPREFEDDEPYPNNQLSDLYKEAKSKYESEKAEFVSDDKRLNFQFSPPVLINLLHAGLLNSDQKTKQIWLLLDIISPREYQLKTQLLQSRLGLSPFLCS